MSHELKMYYLKEIEEVTETQDRVVTRVVMLINAEPRLKPLFDEFLKDYQNGRLASSDIEDIFAYATYRIQRKETRYESQRSENVPPVRD